MDVGAHFHCCDLQVHSPRDSNWTGDCPTTDAERKAYAAEFVSACRQKGLDAIAVTDHHDLATFPYLREASRGERDRDGNRIPASRQIVVFPGMELTLALPCQALLLFDPEVNDDDLHWAMATLGITAAPASAPKAANPVRRIAIGDLSEIYRRLSERPTLKDRFIVLPNINDGGEDTILRHGFASHYKSMPCVGGYIDGSLSGYGRHHTIEGKDPAWGSRRLGLIQTSDSRRRDFANLGLHPTWIKWSVASSEGLRQACLAPDSRLRYSPPLLPDNYISKIEVTNSKYLGPFTTELNPQLNTIIGGRGSGKSTILEYLRWALCDQPYVHHDEEGTELPDFERRRRSLISATLRQWQGNVIVYYIRNGVPHRIRREGATGNVYLKVADQDERPANEETIQSLAQIQGYSQKQLSHVSVRAQELSRLLKSPIAQELATNRSHFAAATSGLRQAFERNESRRNLLLQLQAVDLELRSKQERVRKLSEEVRDLPEEHRRAIEAHPPFLEGQRLATSYAGVAANASETVRNADIRIRKYRDDLAPVRGGLPGDSLRSARQKIEEALTNVSEVLQGIGKMFDGLTPQLRLDLQQIAQAFEEHKGQYEAAASENVTIQQRLESLRTLSEETATTEIQRVELERKADEFAGSDQELISAREQWRTAVDREFALLEQQATKLTNDSNGDLRVRVDRAKSTEPLKQALIETIRGAAITTPEKFESLIRSISGASDPVQAWIELIEELLALARLAPQLATGSEPCPTPMLTQAGFITSEVRRIATKLSPVTAFQLSLVYPESVPVFEYKTVGNAYIPFDEASPGQQATALIGLLLNQTAGPLVVLQPEDDLDMSTILQVAERLWKAKEKRQVIFATHNPNLVVVGDAELVLNCSYTHPGQEARVRINDEGAIDNPNICRVITSVMEGGEEAFRLRKERYGF